MNLNMNLNPLRHRNTNLNLNPDLHPNRNLIPGRGPDLILNPIRYLQNFLGHPKNREHSLSTFGVIYPRKYEALALNLAMKDYSLFILNILMIHHVDYVKSLAILQLDRFSSNFLMD